GEVADHGIEATQRDGDGGEAGAEQGEAESDHDEIGRGYRHQFQGDDAGDQQRGRDGIKRERDDHPTGGAADRGRRQVFLADGHWLALMNAAVRPPARYKGALSPNRKRRLRIMPIIVKKIYTLMMTG